MLVATRAITELERTEHAAFPGTSPLWCRKSPREAVSWGWGPRLGRTERRPPGPSGPVLLLLLQYSALLSRTDSAYLLSSLPALPGESIQASLPLAREGNE